MLIFIVISIVFIYFYIKYHVDKEEEKGYFKFPEPPRHPIVGHTLKYAGYTPKDIFRQFEYNAKHYYPVMAIQLISPSGSLKTYAVFQDPDDVEDILTNQKLISKGSDYDMLKEWLGEGLLMSTGSKWYKRRKIITPTFHFKILERFCEVFDKESSVLVQCLEKHVGKGPIDVLPLVCACAMDIMCDTSMGVKIDAQLGSNKTYVQAVYDMKEIFLKRMVDWNMRFNFLYKFTKLYKKGQNALKILHGFTDNLIKTRREELLKMQDNNNIWDLIDDVGAVKRVAFLDLLLQSTIDGEPLSNLDIREEVDTFMFEGHDTLTAAMSFALYNIGKHQNVQNKCFAEIRNVIGDDLNRDITINDLRDLHYLEMVIKETLRLYPSVPILGRQAVEDTIINGKKIKKGTDVVIMLYFMQRHPKYFNDPDKFYPERFEDPHGPEFRNPFANIPFSAGSRNCIGQRFAMLEMKSLLSKVLRHYAIKVPAYYEPNIVFQLVLSPLNGVVLEFEKRLYD